MRLLWSGHTTSDTQGAHTHTHAHNTHTHNTHTHTHSLSLSPHLRVSKIVVMCPTTERPPRPGGMVAGVAPLCSRRTCAVLQAVCTTRLPASTRRQPRASSRRGGNTAAQNAATAAAAAAPNAIPTGAAHVMRCCCCATTPGDAHSDCSTAAFATLLVAARLERHLNTAMIAKPVLPCCVGTARPGRQRGTHGRDKGC
jgi:hypothetical protein